MSRNPEGTHLHTLTHAHSPHSLSPLSHTHPRPQARTGAHTHRHTNIQTQRHTDTQTYRHADTETQRHRDTETQRHSDTATQRHKDTHTHKHLRRGHSSRRKPNPPFLGAGSRLCRELGCATLHGQNFNTKCRFVSVLHAVHPNLQVSHALVLLYSDGRNPASGGWFSPLFLWGFIYPKWGRISSWECRAANLLQATLTPSEAYYGTWPQPSQQVLNCTHPSDDRNPVLNRAYQFL